MVVVGVWPTMFGPWHQESVGALTAQNAGDSLMYRGAGENPGLEKWVEPEGWSRDWLGVAVSPWVRARAGWVLGPDAAQQACPGRLDISPPAVGRGRRGPFSAAVGKGTTAEGQSWVWVLRFFCGGMWEERWSWLVVEGASGLWGKVC